MTAVPGPDRNHIRLPAADLRARRISAGEERTGVALALGGGFARGFAHLGVLEVLEQEHIPVTAIAGTSIGGLLGAAYADGISIRELCDLGRQVRIRDFLRFHRSSHITPSNDRIGRFVREWFHAGRVEELGIPTAIVTTDIDTCAAHVFTRGPLEVAIRASCAFPGLFQPVAHEGRLLADGCLVAPMPTAVAARMNALCVVGVAVGSDKKFTSSSVNGWEHRAAAAYPNKYRQEPSWSRDADLMLEPDVMEMSWDDFANVNRAHADGVEAMRRALPLVRELLDRKLHAQRPEEPTGIARIRLVS
jgi:NTE family protein